MAAYGRQFIMHDDYQGVFKALSALRSCVNAPAPVTLEQFEPEQEKFLANRDAVVANMVRAMGLIRRKDWKDREIRDAIEATAPAIRESLRLEMTPDECLVRL